ncbi:hypothetical protein MM300_19400 [Evansella sp. LMS18]|uniref:hypothetical protein n=1 Tax=Evansella sp. LMS18 TaxID=2924033 RepID=UPI0020D19600|nr:hypothetical protein [Evansella sp. LMS18]UTR10020.1 hypothetical protein MM300_19400 [Evansella sp. LMS18]
MKAKTIVAYSDSGFDKKLNAFLADPAIEIIDVKFTSPIFAYTALVLYKDIS